MTEARSGRRAIGAAVEELDAELKRIATLGIHDLRALWLKMTGQGAPKALSRDLLARVVAYRIQEQELGKLSREMRQRLDSLARGGGEPVRHLKVGTALVREHQGELHEVMVVPGGFRWQEKTYPSLSAIALAITGTAWNGPRFFGLRGKTSEDSKAEPASAIVNPSRPSSRSAVRSKQLASPDVAAAYQRAARS